VGAIAALGAVAGLSLATAAPVGAGRAPSADRVGVSGDAVVVAGIVGTDPASTGADLGARARFARASRGRGVAGRTIEYLRTAPAADAAAADAAAADLATEAFAVVPAVGSTVGAATLGREGVPFFGIGSSVDWYTNRTGFGVTGVAVNERTRVAASPLGTQLAWVLGDTDDAVLVVHDDDPAGAARAAQARRSLRQAGFRAATVRADPGAGVIQPAEAAVVVLLTSAVRTAQIAGGLAASGSTATVVVGPEFYVPGAPGSAPGMTVLVPIAPFEEVTAGNRRLAADVEAFAPGTVLTTAIAEGYWSADLFVRALERTGRRLTRARVLAVLNGNDFTYEAPGTVGRSVWPEMHTQPVPCGSLVQSDGTQYLVVAPYRCAPARASQSSARSPSSRRKPTFMVTWYHASAPSFSAPRMSVTSNQSRLRSVFDARAMPFLMASSTLELDDPTISVTL
jgi:hypothetical protein